MSIVSNSTPDNAADIVEASIPGEILAAIAAAATVFVGKRLHIRAVDQLHTGHRSVSRWSRQGRVLVQSSHNLPSKH